MWNHHRNPALYKLKAHHLTGGNHRQNFKALRHQTPTFNTTVETHPVETKNSWKTPTKTKAYKNLSTTHNPS